MNKNTKLILDLLTWSKADKDWTTELLRNQIKDNCLELAKQLCELPNSEITLTSVHRNDYAVNWMVNLMGNMTYFDHQIVYNKNTDNYYIELHWFLAADYTFVISSSDYKKYINNEITLKECIENTGYLYIVYYSQEYYLDSEKDKLSDEFFKIPSKFLCELDIDLNLGYFDEIGYNVFYGEEDKSFYFYDK